MSRMIAVLVFVSMIAYSSAAFGIDGNALLSRCQQTIKFQANDNLTDEQTLDAIYCIGFLEGVASLNQTLRVGLYKETEICFPKEGITTGQLARIVAVHLEKNPQHLHMDGGISAYYALRRAFRCPDK